MVRLGSEGLTSSIKYLSFPNQRQVLHTKIHHEILVPCSQKFAMLLRLVAQFPDLVSRQNLAYVLNLYDHFFGFVEEFCKQFDNPMEIYLNLYQLYLTSALREKGLHKLRVKSFIYFFQGRSFVDCLLKFHVFLRTLYQVQFFSYSIQCHHYYRYLLVIAEKILYIVQKSIVRRKYVETS